MTALPSRQNPGRPRFAHVREVFSALGGVRVIAACAGEKVTTVSGWRARNSIPVEHWPALLASGPAGLIGLTSDDLMHACTGAPVQSPGDIVREDVAP